MLPWIIDYACVGAVELICGRKMALVLFGGGSVKRSPPLCPSCLRASHIVDKARERAQDGGHWEDIAGFSLRAAVPCLPLGFRDLRCDLTDAHLSGLLGEQNPPGLAWPVIPWVESRLPQPALSMLAVWPQASYPIILRVDLRNMGDNR